MKKLLCTLTAAICAFCCLFGLTACGDDTVAVESVTLNQTTLTLEIDDTETLTATVTPDNATDKTVTWSSSAPTVASVDSTGKVTAKAEGTATITAKTGNDKTATCAVTVNAPIPADQVNAAQWTQILESAHNYTFAMPGIDFKYVDNKLEFDSVEHQILVKDINKAYVYTANNEGTSWERITLTGDSDIADVNGQIEAYSDLCKIFKESYSAFTYADGKYTADNLNINFVMGGTIKTAEVTFENGNLVGIKFSTEADGGATAQYEIKNVGTTAITLPTKYTEVDN